MWPTALSTLHGWRRKWPLSRSEGHRRIDLRTLYNPGLNAAEQVNQSFHSIRRTITLLDIFLPLQCLPYTENTASLLLLAITRHLRIMRVLRHLIGLLPLTSGQRFFVLFIAVQIFTHIMLGRRDTIGGYPSEEARASANSSIFLILTGMRFPVRLRA